MLGFGEPNTTDIGKGTGRQPRPVSNHHPSVTITVENCSAQTLEAVLSYCLAQTASNPNFAKMDNASIFAVLEVALSQHVQPALNLLLDFLRTRPWRDSYWWQRECWKRSWWDGLAACLQQQHTLAVRRLDAKSPGEVPPWKSAADAYSGACSHALRFNLVLYKRCDDRGAFYLPWLRPPARDAVASACPHGTRPYEETYNVFFADDSQGRVRRWFIHALVALQEHLIEYPSLATLKTCSILYDFAADACGLCKGKALVETERYTSDIGQLVEDVLSQVPFPNHLVIPHSPLPDLPSAETEAHPLISVPRMWL
ncbi:hypothetical protein PsYK624_089390 [Phanerochaete sordida]|uniref:Uncharacterized protein n=1 Tax=Phanerochaete sordida TaxID=48140 RepID=A0A9P3GBM0_9APHY|nr:hypothetical protein PsYK624_089390 [Phanerochaete sordida]